MRRMYSEQQLVKVVEEQDLKPKTIEQQEPNYFLNFGEEIVGLPTGLTYERIYNRFEVINNVLYIVLLFSIENTTENDISTGNIRIDFTLPEEYASKIYDIDGKTLSQSGTASVTAFPMFGANKTYPGSLNGGSYPAVINNNSTANMGSINLYTSTSIYGNIYTIGAGKKQFFSGRLFITLL